jgi:hypothetical protein
VGSGLILVSLGASGADPNPRPQPWLQAAALASRSPAVDDGEQQGLQAPPAPDPGLVRQGFFARLALGTGVFTAYTGSPSDSRRLLGAPLSLEVYLGGSLSPYVSLGAGYARDAIGLLSAHDEVQDGDEPQLGDTSFYLEHLSGFLSVYPGADSPYYGFATLGLGTLNVRKSSDDFELPLIYWPEHLTGDDPSGLILSLGGGYDTGLSPRWALGVSGRVLLGLLTSTETDVERSVTVVLPSVLLSMSYY